MIEIEIKSPFLAFLPWSSSPFLDNFQRFLTQKEIGHLKESYLII